MLFWQGNFRKISKIFKKFSRPLFQVPFYVITMSGTWRFGPDSAIPVLAMFLGYAPSAISPLLYGLSLAQMKEEDMALTARAHKSVMGAQAQQHHHHPHQNQHIGLTQNL